MSDDVKFVILKTLPAAAIFVFFVLFASSALVYYKISMLLLMKKKIEFHNYTQNIVTTQNNFNVTNRDLHNTYIAEFCNKIPSFEHH